MRNGRMRGMDRNELRDIDKVSRETLGKFFYDLAKLVFAGVVLVEATSLSHSQAITCILR